MYSKQSVLIVDRSEENQEVLKTALERRGLKILSASRMQQGLELAKAHRPDLIVLDPELDEPSPTDPYALFERELPVRSTPLVFLGTVRCNRDRRSMDEFVPKPYHYGPLIRRIEELLDAKRSIPASAT